MRALLVPALFVAMMLSGCTGGGGLSEHVVRLGDLDGPFAYMPIGPDEREAGLTRNPGPAPVDDLDDATVLAGYVSAFVYDGGEEPVLISQALRFTNETAATVFFESQGGCGGAMVIQDGAILTTVFVLEFFAEDADLEVLHDQAHEAAHAIEVRIGGMSLCEDETH